jgi:hypothetical protein
MNEEKCALCERPFGNELNSVVNGKTTCLACRDAIIAEITSEADAGVKLAPVIAIGAVASAACGAAWALLIAATKSEIGFAAVGVGYAVGHAVRRASGGKRGRRLQWVAVGCSTLGLLLGKYFFVAHMVRELAARSPSAAVDGIPNWFDPRVFLFFLGVLPRLTGVYDALWLFLALSAAWRTLQPARVVLGDGRNSPPAA